MIVPLGSKIFCLFLHLKMCVIFSAYPPFKLNAFDTTGPRLIATRHLQTCYKLYKKLQMQKLKEIMTKLGTIYRLLLDSTG